jgi:alpha-tubulin suppressor-like RCC1 family protein
MRRALVVFAAFAAACTPVARSFTCGSSAACVFGAQQGTCEATRFCSFPDAACTGSGRRYGAYAGGGLANQCVSGTVAGPGDMSGGDMPAPACGTLDDACCANMTCPAPLTCGAGGTCLGCVVALAAGDAHSCANKADKTIWCWGKNDRGQLGNGTTNDALAPVEVVDNNGIAFGGSFGGAVDLAAGNGFTCARLANNTVACWGANDAGQLGINSAVMQASNPSLVPLSKVGAIGVGASHACAAVDTAGLVWCWGANDSGQLGPGAGAGGSNMPVPAVDKGNQQVTAIALAGGATHSCAIKADHTLWCWGSDVDGELGDATTAATSPSVQAAALGAHVTAVTAGSHFTCALTDGAQASCFGLNSHGQAGVSGGAPVAVPTALALPSVTRIAAGAAHACARLAGGDVRCWGANAHGQLGDGTANDSATPVRARGGAGAIAAGLAHSCAARGDGVDCWGADANGQLGDGTRNDASLPVATRLACP